MIIILSITALLCLVVIFYMRQPKFGTAPNGKRLEQLLQSPNYKDGKFQNQHFTPDLTEGYSMPGIMYDQIFKKFPNRRPVDRLPSVKTDLKKLNKNENVMVWFGHSSYFIQLNGVRFLVDPVFSGNASPIPGTNTSFAGSDIYTADDMPDIDYLLITHDHYDHLDYETIVAMKDKIKNVVCGLGVGSHFELWGFDITKIIEKDWNESVQITSDMELYTAPARHFSGRTFKRNNTLWLSFLLKAKDFKLYMGGDSGYDTHFAEINAKHGSVDLAILDNGQYNIAWQAIHMLPSEVLEAANDLKTKRLFPVHSSKFMLAQHPWDEPLKKITALNKDKYNFPLVTPMIGQTVYLDDATQVFGQWWKDIK